MRRERGRWLRLSAPRGRGCAKKVPGAYPQRLFTARSVPNCLKTNYGTNKKAPPNCGAFSKGNPGAVLGPSARPLFDAMDSADPSRPRLGDTPSLRRLLGFFEPSPCRLLRP